MAMQPRESYQRVFELLQAHHEWFSGAFPLIASENIPSPAVKEAILSDFGNRYAEGWTGERVYAGCRYIDQVEQICIDLAKQLFQVDFADVRPISGVCANLVAYTTFTTPGDTMMALAIPAGGHISMGRKEFGGTAGSVRGLNVEYFPFDTEEMNIDIDATEKKKKATFPGNVSNHHLHHLAGKAIMFAEMLAYGREYAAQIVKNSKALAQALHELGFKVLGEKKGFTKSHLLVADITKYGDGKTIEKKLEDANIILNRNLLPYDIKEGRHFEAPGGIRCGVSEVTRLGMKESEMKEIAQLMYRVVVKGDDPAKVGRNVNEFRKEFTRVHYAFESTRDAYEYIQLR